MEHPVEELKIDFAEALRTKRVWARVMDMVLHH
jgi:hypothetical protein